jgi:hypothetical protein
MPQHPKTLNIAAFKGLNNVVSPESTPPEFLKKALNIDIDKLGGIAKRKGYSLKDSGNYISIWASENRLGCFANKNGNLIEVKSDYSVSTVKSNISNDPVSFDEVDGVIYYTSDAHNGMIVNGVHKDWGIPKNILAPTLSLAVGTLSEGTYQVSFTYVRSDGIESGATPASMITVPNGSGISLNIPNTSIPDIVYSRIYCSEPNGKVLYYAGLSLLNSTFTIGSTSSFSNPFKMFNLDKAPTGHIVKYYRGRIYIAQDNVLWYSEPYQYQHFNLGSNYFEFPERIREVMPVEDGIWLGSDRLYYLSGDSPESFKRSTKEHIKIVEGTASKISGSYIHLDNTPIGYKWLVTSDLGIFVLFNQGLVINLTSQNVALEGSDLGTSVFLQDSGLNQYLSILKTNGNPNNSVVGDLVETSTSLNNSVGGSLNNSVIGDSIGTSIIRNGMTIT